MKVWSKIDRDTLAGLVQNYGVSGVVAAARRLAPSSGGRGGLRRERSIRANGYAVYAAVMVRKRLHPGRLGVGKIAEAMRQEWHHLPDNPQFPDVATYVEEVGKIARSNPEIAADLKRFVAQVLDFAKQQPGACVLPLLWTRKATEYRLTLLSNVAVAEIDGQTVGILIRASGNSGKQ